MSSPLVNLFLPVLCSFSRFKEIRLKSWGIHCQMMFKCPLVDLIGRIFEFEEPSISL
jgi:hypothetical protein